MNYVSMWIFLAGVLVFGWRRTLSYLRFYQQEGYSNTRFRSWLLDKRAFDTRGTLTAVSVAALSWLSYSPVLHFALSILGAGVLGVIVTLFEEDPRHSGKIRLVLTQRAHKMVWVSFGLFTVLTCIPLALTCTACNSASLPLTKAALAAVVLVQLPPLLLMLANTALWPAEKALQASLYDDAKGKLAEISPFVVGITGSYGKTGAKAALGELLNQCLGATFWPKKSINTVMGITRAIREELHPHHRYAVMEMGAYNIGSIKRLCEFTPPKAALVTSVGIMHLERFGSPENVYTAKSEIAQALPPDGILVCNGDSPNARRMAEQYSPPTTLLYGLNTSSGHLDCYATEISFSEKGTACTIHWKGEAFPAFTPLLGRPALLNILGAFTMACALGADPRYAVACLANLEPVDNRLVLDRSGTVSFLRDAYNSNPVGFEAALEVLQSLPATQRVVMTPGMIELGNQQFEQNRRIAARAAEVADIVIVVGKTNRDALLSGLRDAQYAEEKIVIVESREDAFAAVQDRCERGALVLIENDLGDLHEGKVRF